MFQSPSQTTPRQIVKSTAVEIPVLTTNSGLPQFPFPTQDFLRQKYIIGIETYNINDMPKSPLSGLALITAANLNNAFLTLYEQNPEPVDAQDIPSNGQSQLNDLYPMISLHRVQNASNDPFVRELAIFTPRLITWEKSYVKLAPGVTLGNTGGAVCWVFNVYYIGNAGDNF